MDQQGCKLQRIADHLVQNSLLKGSMDNVTCVVVRINAYAIRAMNESLPPHLQQQIDIVNSSVSKGSNSRSANVPRYDAKSWGAASEDDGDIGQGLDNGVSVYYPPGGIGSTGGVGSSAGASYGGAGGAAAPSKSSGGVAQEEEMGRKQASSSRQMNRSRSSNRLTKGNSKRLVTDSYGTEIDNAEADGISRRSQKPQNLGITITGGDGGENMYSGNTRGGRDSSGQQGGQMPFPSSAYRSMHRPYTQASAGAFNSSQLEAVGRTPSAQKALFVPSAYASQMTQGGTDSSGNDAPVYSGGRSYTLFGGNNSATNREYGGYGRPSTSTAEGNASGQQRGYAQKRSENYSNSKLSAESAHRPNSAAPVLNAKIQTSSGPPANMLNGSRYGGIPSHQEFPAPQHSPINTIRGRK